MQRKLSFLKAIVIVHGKSEKQLCDWIKNNLRLNIHVESEKNGTKSIQITSLNRLLKNTIYKSFASFKKKFDNIEIDPNTKKLKENFKVFIIMDTDDCTLEQVKSFKNKKMFLDHWLFEYIQPIWNTKNLEDVLEKSGVIYQSKKINVKKDYVKIFPTDDKYKKTDSLQLEAFSHKLIKCKHTNMDEFILFCLQYDC